MRFIVAGRNIPHREVTPVCRGPTVNSLAVDDVAAALGVPTTDAEALQAWCTVNKAVRLEVPTGQSLEEAARVALERGFLTMVV